MMVVDNYLALHVLLFFASFREQWKGHVHPYYPRFWDGWEPSPDFLGEDGGAGASLAAAAAAQAEQARRRDERERARNQVRKYNTSLFFVS